MKKTAILLTLFISSFCSHAAVSCKENILDLVVHNNGNVYFSTDNTCPNWCLADLGSEKNNDRAYALLLAARTKGEALMMRWDLAACSENNASYAKPSYIFFT
ncbi:MAG: hypothetical protein ABJH28_09220 [Paraglaciecola sp.]|uniref:hypothetical protein n=1 Tax=Paraglaciecola sp. TaxID=1920173 RepID=UPI003263AD5F